MTYPGQNGHVRRADDADGTGNDDVNKGGGEAGGGNHHNDIAMIVVASKEVTMASPETKPSAHTPKPLALARPSSVSGSVDADAVTVVADAEADPAPSCRTGYCRNMPIFVACISLTYLVRGTLLQYTEDILTHIGRRYPITAPELRFVVGCERIGFVSTLLFIAFFGNRMHKPWVISFGALLCAAGSMLMAVPFFVSGPRLFDPRVSQFAIAGLCKQTYRNVSFQTQCDLIPFKSDKDTATFTTICMAKLLVGIGGALYASLGLVYIEEGSKPHRVPLYFGMVIGMHGYGRFVGNLLAAWFTSLPEAVNAAGSDRLRQDFAVYDQERVGRWWLGYPVFASLFTCLSLMTLWFPRYINVPDWVKRRRAKRARMQAELERRMKLKVLASKKRHSTDANGHLKNYNKRHRGRKGGGRRGDGGGAGDEDGSPGGGGRRRRRRTLGRDVGAEEDAEGTLGVVNEVDVMGDEEVQLSDTRGETEGTEGSEDRGTRIDREISGDDIVVSVAQRKRSNSHDGNVEEDGEEEIQQQQQETELTIAGRKHKRRQHSWKDSVTHEPEMVEAAEEGECGDDVERSRKACEDRKGPKAKRAGKVGKSESASHRKSGQRTSGAADAASAAIQRKPRRIRIKKESLSDLPYTVWRLLHNMRVLIVMFGALLGGFYFNGYLATLPEYTQVQFQRSWQTSFILAGVAGPMAWGLGTQVGGILLFRFRSVPLYRATLGVVGCIITCSVLTLLNMSLGCAHDTSPNSTMTAVCKEQCECDSYKVQFEPLCGSDGKTYPSPCHAGCTNIERTETVGKFNFTGCRCVGGGSAMQGACVPECSQLVGFIIITFLAVTVVSLGIVPVFLILFRSVRSRSKSFTVGFAIWVVYTLSQTLGPVAFTYPRDSGCLLWGKDCLKEDVCWGHDLKPYRLLVNGLAAIFLFASAITFLLVYWYSKRSRARRLKQETAGQELHLEPAQAIDGTSGSAQIDDVTDAGSAMRRAEKVVIHADPDVFSTMV